MRALFIGILGTITISILLFRAASQSEMDPAPIHSSLASVDLALERGSIFIFFSLFVTGVSRTSEGDEVARLLFLEPEDGVEAVLLAALSSSRGLISLDFFTESTRVPPDRKLDPDDLTVVSLSRRSVSPPFSVGFA